MAASRIEALLFDLGGVVVEIDFNRAFAHWQSISRLSLAELKAAFTFDAPYQRHERGEISALEYFAHLAQHLQLRDDPLEHVEGAPAAEPAAGPARGPADVKAALVRLGCAV